MKRPNTGSARWYLCECEDAGCDAEFFMTNAEYQRWTLNDDVKIVASGHRPRNHEVLAVRGDAFVTIPKRRKR